MKRELSGTLHKEPTPSHIETKSSFHPWRGEMYSPMHVLFGMVPNLFFSRSITENVFKYPSLIMLGIQP